MLKLFIAFVILFIFIKILFGLVVPISDKTAFVVSILGASLIYFKGDVSKDNKEFKDSINTADSFWRKNLKIFIILVGVFAILTLIANILSV